MIGLPKSVSLPARALSLNDGRAYPRDRGFSHGFGRFIFVKSVSLRGGPFIHSFSKENPPSDGARNSFYRK
jgi:hypothetical protein